MPPLSVTTPSAPTLSEVTANVPAPWIVGWSSVWLPFLNSSVAPAAMLKTPVFEVVLVPWNSIVPAFTLVVPVLL